MKTLLTKTRTRTTGRMPRGAQFGLLVALLGLLATGAAAADEMEFDYGAVDLRVAVWVDKSADEIYRKGSFQTVGFQTSEDAYAVVYRIDTEGEVTVLWPRSRLDDGFVFGGHEYELPVSGERRLRVATSEGEGYVQAIVSRYPFDLRDLELDFHHEPGAELLAFRVAGDPYLAMNEINFAVTGLEDADDYVVTNYASYYVHQEVDHPRYLCNQCHIDDDTDYHPYRDSCQLNITVDYRWGNTWWDTYGYYPVYHSPVYVYVDPWTWRPWVNFWYDPWWRCPPVWGVHWPRSVYVWHDHHYYRGNCNSYFFDGYFHDRHRYYRPLTPSDQPRRKVREYGRTAPMLADGRTKTGKRGERVAYESVPRTRRDRPVIADATRDRSRGGLRIRDGALGNRYPTGGIRHSAGGTRKGSELRKVTRDTKSRRADPARQPGVRSGSRGSTRDGVRTRDGGGLRTVEPRNKGTRIWSLDRGDTGRQRQERTQRVRPGGSRDAGRDAAGSRRSKGDRVTNPRQGSGRKSDAVRGGGSSGGGSRSKATVRGKSGSGSRSGGSRSSGSAVRNRSSSGGGSDASTRSGSNRSSSTKGSSGGRSQSSKATRSGGSSSRSSGGGRNGKRR